ncbi:(Na+)-NQR maturation NqrM [Ursidibacter arcticus]
METILLTFGFFVAIVFMMSIGFIIKGKTIKGSCGGITALGMKKMCDCEEPCDNLQAKLAAGDEAAKAEYEQKFAKKETQFYEVR